MHARVKLLGDADVDHTQIIGGDTVKLLQDISPRVSDPLVTELPTPRHRCNISSKEAVLPSRNGAEMGSANSLHPLAYCSEYNERFDLN